MSSTSEAERSVGVDARPQDLRRRLEDCAAENAHLREALQARDAFLAVAAHELRNPMTPILGRVTLLRRSIAKGDVSPDEIAQRLEHLEGLVTQFIKRATTLLDVSRMASERVEVERQPVELCGLISEIADSYRPLALHAGATLDLRAVSGGVSVIGDRVALEQVVENLVSNAIKYGDGAPITIFASAAPVEGVARIFVRDEGPGIPVEQQARIFERFARAVHPGTGVTGYGIGLWVVRNLCEAMDGTIDVVSHPGQGSTFCVTLPLQSTMGAA